MGTDQPVIQEKELLGLLKRAASDLHVKAWIVGGYVRDKLLGRPHLNPDVVVEDGDAAGLAQRFAQLAGAPPPVTFERFGTAQVALPGRLVEFVTARAESYAPDSRKPEVRRATLEEDLRRRDFTVNTLLMDFDGNVRDLLGARQDLEAKILRTPADPMLTFADDPLRMLRAVRFAAELGFEPAPDLVPAMRRLGSRLAPPVVSIERTAGELRRMLTSERPKLALELLDEAGLLEMLLAKADIAASAYPHPEKLDELEARLDAVMAERPSRLEPLITGEDIMRIRSIPPGPEVGRIKQKLEELVIDGEIAPGTQALIDYLSAHPDL